MAFVISKAFLWHLPYNIVMENKFKDRLKELRIENNLSQTELAKQSGLSQAAIAKWESGDRTPNMHCIIILTKFFKTDANYLLGIED